MALLFHKTGLVNFPMATTVNHTHHIKVISANLAIVVIVAVIAITTTFYMERDLAS